MVAPGIKGLIMMEDCKTMLLTIFSWWHQARIIHVNLCFLTAIVYVVSGTIAKNSKNNTFTEGGVIYKIIVRTTRERQIFMLKFTGNVTAVRNSHCPTILSQLTGISENERFPSQQKIIKISRIYQKMTSEWFCTNRSTETM